MAARDVAHARHAAVLVDPHARIGRRAGEAERVVERMEVAAVGVVQAAAIAGRLHVVAEFVGFDEVEAVVAEALRGLVAPAFQRIGVALGVRGGQVAGHQRAVDVVRGDARLHERQRFEPHVPDALHVAFRHELPEGVDVACKPADQLAAVAAARRPSDPRRFEHGHRMAALGEVERGGQAREARADHAHVGVDRAGERRVAGRIVGGRRVVGRDVRLVGECLHDQESGESGLRTARARGGTASRVRARVAARRRRRGNAGDGCARTGRTRACRPRSRRRSRARRCR